MNLKENGMKIFTLNDFLKRATLTEPWSLSKMRDSILIKVVIRSDGFSMAPPVAIAVAIFARCKAKVIQRKWTNWWIDRGELTTF